MAERGRVVRDIEKARCKDEINECDENAATGLALLLTARVALPEPECQVEFSHRYVLVNEGGGNLFTCTTRCTFRIRALTCR